jgi:hypothetical protein
MPERCLSADRGAPVTARIDRRCWLGRTAVFVLAPLAGCAAFYPREISLSEAELLSALANRFPAERRVMQVFDLKLARPRLKLLPADNRIAIALDLGLQDTVLRKQFDGGLGFTTGLRYDPARQSVVLTGVRADSASIDGVPRPLAGTVNQWGGWLAEQLLEGSVVRKVSSEELDRVRSRGLHPGAIRVTDRGVALALEEEASAR